MSLPGVAFAGHACEAVTKTLLTLPAITVASDAPVGAVLWSDNGIQFSTTCSVYAFQAATDAALYRQNLQLAAYGLSFALGYRSIGGSTLSAIDTGTLINRSTLQGSVAVNGYVQLQLVKTGTTPSSGNVSQSTMTAFYIVDITNLTDSNRTTFNIANLNGIRFTSYTCDIDSGSRSISVPLGDMREDKFTSIGTTSPDKTFNINLNCTQPSGAYNATLTFNATADSSQAPGVMALASDASSASGVGIQLLTSGQPVSLNTALSVGVATTGTTISVPMTARYYQTAAKVKPGKANGVATFVVSYK